MSDDDALTEELAKAAHKAVYENVRHSSETLYELLSKWFPEATDEQISAAVEAAL
jgi:hypothetical protein